VSKIEAIHVYDSQTTAYHAAFKTFLEHTDQKINARQWLDCFVRDLPARRVLIDAGAGNGQVTAWLAEAFDRTVAIEPNASLCAELRQACPTAEILPLTILEAQPSVQADLILCSHVLYYIERSEWQATVARMASWLAPRGNLIVILQNHETDCMRMLRALLGCSFDLQAFAGEYRLAHGRQYEINRHTVAAHITTRDLSTAYSIAEFMLNLVPMPAPPARRELETYINNHFALPDSGGFRFSCHQDFLLIHSGQ
jgi:SAM-dependent methyltransferase